MIIPFHILIAAFFCALATFVYARFVAREIHRREKYLAKRLEDKIAEWEEKQKREGQGDEDEIIELAEVAPAASETPETDPADAEPRAA